MATFKFSRFRWAALSKKSLLKRKLNATVRASSNSFQISKKTSMWTPTARFAPWLARSARVKIRLSSVSPSQDSTPLITPESRLTALRLRLSMIAPQLCTQRTSLANAAHWKAKRETPSTKANTPLQMENWSTPTSPPAALNTRWSTDALLAAKAMSCQQTLWTASAAHSAVSSAIKDTTASSATWTITWFSKTWKKSAALPKQSCVTPDITSLAKTDLLAVLSKAKSAHPSTDPSTAQPSLVTLLGGKLWTHSKFLKYARLPANKTVAAPALSMKMAYAVPSKAMSAQFITTTTSSVLMTRLTTVRFLSDAANLKMSARALISKK